MIIYISRQRPSLHHTFLRLTLHLPSHPCKRPAAAPPADADGGGARRRGKKTVCVAVPDEKLEEDAAAPPTCVRKALKVALPAVVLDRRGWMEAESQGAREPGRGGPAPRGGRCGRRRGEGEGDGVDEEGKCRGVGG